MHVTHVSVDEGGDAGAGKGKRHFSVCAFLTCGTNECHKLLTRQRTDDYFKFFRRRFRKKEVKTQTTDDPERLFFLDGLRKIDYRARVGIWDCYDKDHHLHSIESVSERKLAIVRPLVFQLLGEHPTISEFIFDKGLLDDDQINELERELKEKLRRVPKMDSYESHKKAGLAYADLIANAARRHRMGDSTLFAKVIKRCKITEL